MTQKITKAFALFSLLVAFAAATTNAQTVYLLKQNFDSIKVTHLDSLPTGWHYSEPFYNNNMSAAWFVDTLRTNSCPMYYTGSGYGTIPDTCSGFDHVVIRNNLDSTGTYELFAPSFSTVGITGINVTWGSRTTASFATPGSTTPTLYFSVDNGATWDSVAYTRVSPDGAWHQANNATPIALPTKAENKVSVVLKWSCYIVNSSNGTCRLDDITVKGTKGTLPNGINDLTANNSINIVPNPATDKFMVSSDELKNGNVVVNNLIGQTIRTINNCNFPVNVERNNLPNGVYFIQITNQQNQLVAVKKLILN